MAKELISNSEEIRLRVLQSFPNVLLGILTSETLASYKLPVMLPIFTLELMVVGLVSSHV